VVEQAQRRLDAAGASMREMDELAAAVRQPGEQEPPAELLVKVGKAGWRWRALLAAWHGGEGEGVAGCSWVCVQLVGGDKLS
jgi:hypothetical protein